MELNESHDVLSLLTLTAGKDYIFEPRQQSIRIDPTLVRTSMKVGLVDNNVVDDGRKQFTLELRLPEDVKSAKLGQKKTTIVAIKDDDSKCDIYKLCT